MTRNVAVLTIEPSIQWQMLKAETLRKIDEIDRATPWQETEPEWWLRMMDVRELLVSKV